MCCSIVAAILSLLHNDSLYACLPCLTLIRHVPLSASDRWLNGLSLNPTSFYGGFCLKTTVMQPTWTHSSALNRTTANETQTVLVNITARAHSVGHSWVKYRCLLWTNGCCHGVKIRNRSVLIIWIFSGSVLGFSVLRVGAELLSDNISRML